MTGGLGSGLIATIIASSFYSILLYCVFQLSFAINTKGAAYKFGSIVIGQYAGFIIAVAESIKVITTCSAIAVGFINFMRKLNWK